METTVVVQQYSSEEVYVYDQNPAESTLTDSNRTSASMRHDMVSEKAVDIGIRLQEILGTSDAARFLRNNVVNLDVALRVLLHPSQRRRT